MEAQKISQTKTDFKHPHFRPIFLTHSENCNKRDIPPTATYLMSVIAAWCDMSSGAGITEKDLCQIKCGGVDVRSSAPDPETDWSRRISFEAVIPQITS